MSDKGQNDFCRLKSKIGYQVAGLDSVFVMSETQSFHLRGKVFPSLFPLLREGISVQNLLKFFAADLPATEVIFAINSLIQRGFICHWPSADVDSEDAVFWEGLGQDQHEVSERLQQAKVAILDLSASKTSINLQAALATKRIAVQENAALQIVLVDDYLDENLAEINRRNHVQKTPWILAKPVGELIWIGPWMLPNQTACWECLRHRIMYRRKLAQYLREHQHQGKASSARIARFSCATDIAHACITAEVSKYIALCNTPDMLLTLPSMNHVLTLNSLSYEREQHVVTRRPQCACCGDSTWVAAQQTTPINLALDKLDRDAKVQNRDNGLRLKSAQEITDELSRHISPITGIIGATNVVSLAGDVHGITRSVAAEHNFSLIDSDSSFLQEQIRGCAGGKGSTLIQAQASALCESIERYSGMIQGDEKTLRATKQELVTAIHPNNCMLFSAAQYQQRDQINASGSRIAWVPERFDETANIEWTPLWSLNHESFYYLPTSYCFYGHARISHCRFTKADSNGCAAGSTLEEAILQGFLELVERDAAALWWYNRSQKAGLDLDSFNDPYLSALQAFYLSCGRSFWVLDITSDLGIPSFVALCAKPGAEAEQITFAFGTHFDAKIALHRAVTELNQIMPNLSQQKATTLQSLGSEALRWWEEVKVTNNPYLLPNAAPQRKWADYPNTENLSINAAVKACLSIARKNDLNVLVLDQSRPDTGLKVVKVVVPSLRHFWPRFAQGRLYESADAVSDETELNPWPTFI